MMHDKGPCLIPSISKRILFYFLLYFNDKRKQQFVVQKYSTGGDVAQLVDG
jgi:hypothetical protein